VLLLAWYMADSIRRFYSKTNLSDSIRDLIRTKKKKRFAGPTFYDIQPGNEPAYYADLLVYSREVDQ